MEKIFKTLEALKVPSLSSSEANIPGTISSAVVAASDSVKTKKKERISHCLAVTDAVCTYSVQGLAEYPKILESVTEVLFQLCNDSDSDIRLVASDCLNRIIRVCCRASNDHDKLQANTLKDQLQPRFQMEIFKEIKKNQSPRSLKTALSLFAFMSPLIRPQKCRAFMNSLLPCFAQVSKRTEELLFENMAPSFSEIFKNLGPFVNDNEVKMLCKDFIRNLESSSAIIRRSSASILVSICQYSRKPHVFLPKLLSQVTELLMPNLMEKNVSVIIGVLLCIRQCIPPIYQQLLQNIGISSCEQENVVQNIVQVYEMCLILCNHDDHNVITTSLETLQQLLTSPVEKVAQRLTSPNGIQNSLDADKWTARLSMSQMSTSMCSLTFSEDVSNLLEGDSDVLKFRNMTSSSTSECKDGFDIDMSISSRRNSDLFVMESASEPEIGSSLEALQQSDDEHAAKSDKTIVIHNFPEIFIGSLYEKNVPIYYCARFLAYNFLLAGQKGHERPDAEVRVSVKVLATNCIINLISICPEIFTLPLSPQNVEASDVETQQTIQDIFLYASHNDPLLRGSIYILVGSLIKSVLLTYQGKYHNFAVGFDQLVPILQEGLRDSSNIGVKCAITGIANCLVILWRNMKGGVYAEDLFNSLLKASVNPYWLVKVDLIELLTSIEWDCVLYREEAQHKVMNVLLNFLSDEDSRVRASSALALVKFVGMCGRCEEWNQLNSHVFCPECVVNDMEQTKPDNCISDSTCKFVANPETARRLEILLNRIIPWLGDLENKHSVSGFYSALANVSEHYPPNLYKSAWRCHSGVSDVSTLFTLSIDLLRSSPIVYDISVHQSLMTLSCNLFIGSESGSHSSSGNKGKSIEDGNPFLCNNANVSNYGVQLLQHCLAVMKLYQNVMETINPLVPSRKASTSPVISPVKKFSQKLEAEKKSQESESEKKGKTQVFTSTVCPNHFKKIGDSLNQSWRIYKSNLDPVVTQKFSSLLTTALHTLGRLCFCIRPDYSGMASLIEEVLSLTSSIFYLCPVPTLRCIRKMLTCIFSSYEIGSMNLEGLNLRPSWKNPLDEFRDFSENYHTTLLQNRRSSALKTPSEKSALGRYIRQFEPIVITALKIYTTSSNVDIQAEVMRLLSQLIKGHVNYGLVDSNQVFLGFVIKQIGFLEEGHIRNSSVMVQEMFQFLTLLSHEHQPTKKFIDVPKVLRLCDGLVASGQGYVLPNKSLGVPALRPVVYDLFVQRGSSTLTNFEKKEIETQREVLLQMLLKLSATPEILSVMWVLIKGRKAVGETKWIEDSYTLMNSLLPDIQHGNMIVKNRANFNSLAAIVLSVYPSSIPPIENLVAAMQSAIKTQIDDVETFLKWTVLVNSHMLMLIKMVTHNEQAVQLECLNASLFLEIIHKFITDFTNTVSHFGNYTQFFVQQLQAFFHELVSLLREAKLENLKSELRKEDNLNIWLRICDNVVNLAAVFPVFRMSMVKLLSVLLYSRVEVWALALRTSSVLSREVLPPALILIMNELNEGDVPNLEEWIIVNHSKHLLVQMNHTVTALFINRLSKYRLEQILDQITILLTTNVEVLLARHILKFLQRVSESFLCETAVLALELLKQTKVVFLAFEVSQFASFVFGQIRTRRVLFSSIDRESIRNFLAVPSIDQKYPRLVTLVSKVVQAEFDISRPETKLGETPIHLWCCGEMNSTEGISLAKMLSSLKYTQIMNVFTQPGFNMSFLQYCFRYLHDLYLTGVVSADEVIELFTSEKRSGVIDKWPLGVATFEFIVETLDAWENSVPEDLLSLTDGSCNELVTDLPFSQKLPQMWSALSEMLRLKNSVIKTGSSNQKGCCNNFIPTTIFTVSFQYMRARCQRLMKLNDIPLDNLQGFLTFASMAVCDSSFLSFFNVRDNSSHIFTCVVSLGCILRKIVALFNINFVFSQSGADSYSEMNDICAKVLTEFYYLTEFIYQVKRGKLALEFRLYKSLKDVVAGLGRCELINGWVLISHLGWKPQVICKTQIFPPVQNIPLEILREEKDLLLQYIFKLNLFGVASKIQFEENWMTFLSVINSYGDESFQLQIVTTGLRALTMMLEQSVKITYVPELEDEIGKRLSKIDLALKEVQPELCKRFYLPPLFFRSIKRLDNQYSIDVNSCIRFLTDLFSQWLQNSQEKMPLLLLSEVVQSIVSMSEYFEDSFQYTWMYETLMEIFKSFEKEDEILWPHLLYGIFYAAARIPLEPEAITNLMQILEGTLSSPSANVANASVSSALIFLQNHSDSVPLLNLLAPYVLKNTQLNETVNDSESHSSLVWTILLFIWIYGPSESIGGADFEQETLGNILTILSPLNKVYVSVRLLVLKGLRAKVETGVLKPEIKKKISKVTLETLCTPNICIFFETVRVFLAIFYTDFRNCYEVPDADPEALMQMAERSEILFQLLKSPIKCNCQIISKVLPHVVMDFLPPSEILNRVIAEFMSPPQTSPELLAPVVAQVFEKARRRPKEAALVREWILASLANFVSNADVARTMWSLTLFFVGVSTTNEVSCLLPFAQLRRRSSQIKQLFIHSALDFYSTLEARQKEEFRKLMRHGPAQGDDRHPYSFLVDLINSMDSGNQRWEFENGFP